MSAGGDAAGATAEAEGSWGSGEGSAAAGSSGDSSPKPSAPVTQTLPSGPPIATLPTFEVLADGRSLVTVQVSGKTTASEQKAEGRLVYALKGVQVPARVNRMPLPTQNFETRVSQVQLEQTPDGANLVIDLREPAEGTEHTVSDLEGGTMLAVTIPKTVRYAAATEPTDPGTQASTEPDGGADGGSASDEDRAEEEAEISKSTGRSARKRGGGGGDEARFRGAIAGVGGLLVDPAEASVLGMLGLQGELGVQIDDLTGIVFIPGFGYVLGDLDGAYATAGILVDFTFDDFFTFGLGPQVLGFAAGDVSGAAASVAAGAFYGGLVRFAIHPVLGYGQEGRRKALTIGLDVRLLAGPRVITDVNASGPARLSGELDAFILSPVFTVGYTAF